MAWCILRYRRKQSGQTRFGTCNECNGCTQCGARLVDKSKSLALWLLPWCSNKQADGSKALHPRYVPSLATI